MLSAYRLMWMMVLFDLPVLTKEERSRATKFRQFLLDEGFEMSQFSVYFRFCGSRERAETYMQRIKKNLPPYGKISVIQFTDRQFADIASFRNTASQPPPKNAEQYLLF